MAIFRKLDRLIASEIISLTFVITASLSSVLIMIKFPRYANLLFSAPDSGTTFFMLLLFILPSVLKLTLPISLLLASALVSAKMSADREIEAWMASGVSVLRLSYMPIFLGIIVMIVSLWFALFFEPYSNKSFNKFQWLQSQNAVEAMVQNSIREKSFVFDALPIPENAKLTMYLQSVSSDRSEFSNIFIGLKSNHEKHFSVIVAKSGTLKKEKVNGLQDYIFSLNDGYVYSCNTNKVSLEKFILQNKESLISSNLENSHSKLNLSAYPSFTDWNVTQFSEMQISLLNSFKSKFKIDSNSSNNINQLYPNELYNYIDRLQVDNSDWRYKPEVIQKIVYVFKQISIPFCSIFLALIGICLGIQDSRKKQIGVYLGVGIIIFILYSSVSLSQQLATSLIFPPTIAFIFAPLALILTSCILLRWRLRHPPSVSFITFIKDDLLKIKIFSRKG